MQTTPWIMIIILVLIIVLGIVAIALAKKGKQRPPDYYAFFWMGLIWTIFGLFFYMQDKSFAFLGMGVVFLAIGLANRDKWEKNRARWNDLTEKEKKFKLTVIIILGLLVLAGMVAYYLVERGII